MRTVPVTHRALVQRINRALKKDNKNLKAARSEKVSQELGGYFVVDLHRNAVVSKDVDLEEFGRELGALQKFERLVD